ncbi:MAG: SagB/ThcOx family dehydrogenase [Anaerolineales bacterium]|nr:SagB/ThcOx family dehydrogenase [Anaerolineales bacterium]
MVQLIDLPFSKINKETNPKVWPLAWKKVYFKRYPWLSQTHLPLPSLESRFSLADALLTRRSIRNFSKIPVTLQEISDLLFFSAGIKEVNPTWSANRTYPSAGSRYPLETYLAVLNACDIKPGIYHYFVKTHSLEILLTKPFKNVLFDNLSEKWARDAGILLIISSVFFRTEIKYGARGFRHILMETGHLCQNFYLVSTSLSLGCCSIGGYIDDGINGLLDLDGLAESVVAILAIGKI